MIILLPELTFKELLKISDQLEITYAGRYDKFNFIDEGAFAPRVAIVYKANDNHTFRASFNRANTGPSALQQNIDFPVSVIAPGIADVWLSGQYAAQVFPDNPTIDLSIPGLPDLPYGTTQFPLAYAYGAVAAPTLGALYNGLARKSFLRGGSKLFQHICWRYRRYWTISWL